MAGETAVETPQAPVAEEKKDLAEVSKEEEKKDEEKKEEVKEEKSKTPAKKEKKVKAPPAPQVHKKDYEKDVVYMYQFGRTKVLPSLSPYCLKLETWLKLQGVKYENVEHNAKLRSKRGLLPFIELNGEEVADSELVIRTLSKQLDKDLDQGMEQDQLNMQHAMSAMVDCSLMKCFTHWYTRDVTYAIRGFKLNLQQVMSSKLPNSFLQFLMKNTYLRKTAKGLSASGFKGYSHEEVDDMGKKDLKTLSDFLGEKQFMFGDEPRTLDLKTFIPLAFMLNVAEEVPCPLRDYVQNDCKNLVGLYNRMKDRAWGDHWEEATSDKMEMNPHIPKPEPPKEEEKKEEKKEEDKKEDKAEEKKEEEAKKEEKDNKEEEDKK